MSMEDYKGFRSVESKNVIGLPLEAQLFWKATGFLGLGVSAYGDINKARSFGGLLFNLHVGDLR